MPNTIRLIGSPLLTRFETQTTCCFRWESISPGDGVSHRMTMIHHPTPSFSVGGGWHSILGMLLTLIFVFFFFLDFKTSFSDKKREKIKGKKNVYFAPAPSVKKQGIFALFVHAKKKKKKKKKTAPLFLRTTRSKSRDARKGKSDRSQSPPTPPSSNILPHSLLITLCYFIYICWMGWDDCSHNWGSCNPSSPFN